MSAARILVVDDLTLHRTVLVRLLQAFGACEQAHDGAEAFELYQRALAEKKPYRLICLDIVMPNVDGNEALRMIREEESRLGVLPDSKVKILMTTAQNDSTSVMEAMRGHCDGYLLKPIQRESLEAKLHSLGFESSGKPKPAAETKSAAPAPQPKKESPASPAKTETPPSSPKPTAPQPSGSALPAGLAPE